MVSRSNFTGFFVPIISVLLLTLSFSASEREREQSYLIFYGEKSYDEPATAIVKLNLQGELEIVDVQFPEDLMQFIECCKQDTILHQPVKSYLNRTELMVKSDRLNEEKHFRTLMTKMLKLKKKFGRKWKRSEGWHLINADLEICNCYLNDPNVVTRHLNLLKNIN